MFSALYSVVWIYLVFKTNVLHNIQSTNCANTIVVRFPLSLKVANTCIMILPKINNSNGIFNFMSESKHLN